jgi:hypothetical protein
LIYLKTRRLYLTTRGPLLITPERSLATTEERRKMGASLGMVLRQFLQPSGFVDPRLPRGVGFLIGASSAAFLVLAVTGAGLMLSSSAGGAASGEAGYYRLPRAALSLGIRPALHPAGIAG